MLLRRHKDATLERITFAFPTFLACKCPLSGQASLNGIHLVHWRTARAILVLVCNSLSLSNRTLPAAVVYAAPCVNTTQKLVIEKIEVWMTTL